LILHGQPIFSQYKGNDYFVERGKNGYLIQDPRVAAEGISGDVPCDDYPGNKAARTAEEFMALPFLDGKTIFERFDELKFFEL
jgi:hypothetical protein